MTAAAAPLPLERIRAAGEALRGRVLETPLVPAGALRTPGGNPVLLKAENLQATGSFKVRGATFKLSRLRAEGRSRGVVAYSTGNHAQAVARAACRLGVPATIVMSPDAPRRKVQATARWGATVTMAEPTSRARRELAERLAREGGLALVPPYDDRDVMAGQGTVGLEVLEQLERAGDAPPEAVFVPVGGGGLIAGVAAAVKQAASGVRVVGVEPELENDAWMSFRRGERARLPAASASVADAVKVQTLGDLTYPVIRRYVDDVVTVTERRILHAVVLAADEAHLVLEPAGALALAAALEHRADAPSPERPVVAIASGGNTTMDALRRALAAETDKG